MRSVQRRLQQTFKHHGGRVQRVQGMCMLDELPNFVHELSESWREHGWRKIHRHLVEMECEWGRVWTLQEWILPKYPTETTDFVSS